MTRADFIEWRQRVIALDGDSTLTTLTADDLVVLASPKPIHAEYRFYVVDGRVVTGSMYKRGDLSWSSGFGHRDRLICQVAIAAVVSNSCSTGER